MFLLKQYYYVDCMCTRFTCVSTCLVRYKCGNLRICECQRWGEVKIIALVCVCVCACIRWPTGWEWSLLCKLGLCWSTHTTFFISSKLGSEGTMSKKGGRYSSTIPKTTQQRFLKRFSCAVSSVEQKNNYQTITTQVVRLRVHCKKNPTHYQLNE